MKKIERWIAAMIYIIIVSLVSTLLFNESFNFFNTAILFTVFECSLILDDLINKK